ncbi:MAG: UPF0179 family protein [Thermoplasmatota archaeon]
MGPLTLVPETLARPGHRFTFAGANKGEECQGCPVQKLCFGLQSGVTYEVTELRDVTHPCQLHDGDRVRVVTAQPASFHSTVETKRLRGTATTWKPIPCGLPECSRYALCHPKGPTPGEHYEILTVGDAVECPAGYDIQQVELKRRLA